MKALILNSRNWWLSENELVSSTDSFVYAQNIDFQRKFGSIILSSQNVNSFTTDGLINAFAGAYYFTDTGKIYYDSGNLRYTMTSYPITIYNAIFFNWYYYWITNSALHRVSLWWSVTTPWNSVQENFAILENSTCYPMLNYYNQSLYIWCGNILKVVDINGNVADALTAWGTITWITMFAGNLKIYTDETDGGKLYYLNSSSFDVSSVIEFKDLDFRTVINDGGTDYALIWTNYNLQTSAFLATSGYSSAILKKAISRDSLFQFVWNIGIGEVNCMAKYKDMIYIPSKQWIYSFGNYNPWFDKIFNLDYAISNDKIWILKAESEKLYLSYTSGWVNYLDKINLGDNISNFMQSGEVISHIYNGWSFCENKKLEQIKLWFDKLLEWQKIEIFIKKNGQSDWGTAIATVDYANTSDREIYFKTLIWPKIDIWAWNYLQIKIKLTAWTGNFTSPKLYELFLWFDTIS